MADNTYKEAISKDSRRQIPKNLRQIGKINDGIKIYVEDYVKTFIRQLAETEPEGLTAAVLVGEYVKNEQDRFIFIYGAIKLIDIFEEDAIIFTEDTWTTIYETIKHYFPEGEIAGWYIRKNEWTERNYNLLNEVHLDNFAGRDKILMQYDLLEKDGEFYCYENGMLIPQSGYFIYYDKNEEMQDYMIDNKQQKREEEHVTDHAVREFRALYQEKHPPVKKDQKQSVMRLMYGAGAVLVMVVLAVGITAMNNYEKVKGLEEALQTISNSLHSDNKDSNPTKSPVGIFDNVDSNNTQDNSDNESFNNNEDSSNDFNGMDATDKNGTNNDNNDNKTDNSNNKSNDSDNKAEGSSTENTSSNNNTQAGQNKENSAEVTSTPKNPTPTEGASDNKAPTSTPVPDAGQEALKPLYTADQLTAYIVEKGDTLVGICYKLYGNVNQMKIIQELNQIADENKIYIGQELIVPK